MRPSVTIAMPWRDLGCPHRRRAYEFVSRYWRLHLPAAELIVSAGPEPFSRAAALNDAISRGSGDIIFQCDPDSLAWPSSVRSSIKLASEKPGLVVCHTACFYLSKAKTAELLDAGLSRRTSIEGYGPDDCEGSGMLSVNIACFSRATWLEAGGYEERFGMWGGDDSAFALACGTLVGEQRRTFGDWVHLWHPRLPQSLPGSRLYAEQFMILNEYVKAAGEGPEAMRKLVGRPGR